MDKTGLLFGGAIIWPKLAYYLVGHSQGKNWHTLWFGIHRYKTGILFDEAFIWLIPAYSLVGHSYGPDWHILW